MIATLKNWLGAPAVDYSQLVKEGAIILDVRTKNEFRGGHIAHAVNIAVDQLPAQLHRLPEKSVPIITCCASGMRSSLAKRILVSQGYETVYNGGDWRALQKKI